MAKESGSKRVDTFVELFIKTVVFVVSASNLSSIRFYAIRFHFGSCTIDRNGS